MARELTERQQKFLDVLFEEAQGDLGKAKKLAGYSDTSNIHDIIRSISDEIVTRTQDFLSRNAPKAALAMVGVVSDPTALGNRDRLAASREILDRVGVIKTEKVQVEASGGVMILPPKKSEDDTDN
ncbi:MAG: hypothetical protein CMQ40_06940 [Gammaproteobacteria bacterium]|nr:hypothetical protein [Gammaproteobacteria bacterium]